MKKIAIVAALIATIFVVSCAHSRHEKEYKARDYQWHKTTMYARIHWNYIKQDNEIIADGFIEPIQLQYVLTVVKLSLVGFDANDNIVNRAGGAPEDSTIASPIASSPFRINMKLNGREKDFSVTGSYYYYLSGSNPDYSQNSYVKIPLHSDIQ